MRSSGNLAGKLRPEKFIAPAVAGETASTDAGAQVYSVFDPAGYAAATLPTASVVICTRHRPAMLQHCLEHLSESTHVPDEILVVDNSSGDEQTQRLAEAFGARYIVEGTSGLSAARNRSLLESRCDVVAFLDDDSIPESTWLERLLIPFMDDRVAAVAGEIIGFAPGDSYTSGRPMGLVATRYVTRNTPRWFEMASFGGIGTGCNMAFRKRACHRDEFFDQRLGRGAPFRIAEENCAFATVLAEGYAAVVLPDVRVYHPEKEMDVALEATSRVAYWMLLFFKFPENRLDLVRFLIRRVFSRRLPWRLGSQNANSIVSSSWKLKARAIWAGARLYYRERNSAPGQLRSMGSRALTLISRRRVEPDSVAAP